MRKIFSLWASTWRIRYAGLSGFIDATNSKSVAVGMWHEDLCIVAFSMRKYANRFHPMVSLSRDGERATQWLSELGYDCVRGSSSKGGSDALNRFRALLKDKQSVAVTLDGPRGPRRVAKPGLFRLGQTMECDLWMIHTEARGWRLPTWDHQLIPWPFARVTLHFKRNEEPLTRLEAFQDWLNRQT